MTVAGTGLSVGIPSERSDWEELEIGYLSDVSEVSILGEERDVCPERDCRDHAVDQSAWSPADSAAGGIQTGCGRNIGLRLKWNGMRPEQEPASKNTVWGRSHQLHFDWIGRADRLAFANERFELKIRCTARSAVALNPNGGIDEDHSATFSYPSLGTSPKMPAPRVASISDFVIGWPTR